MEVKMSDISVQYQCPLLREYKGRKVCSFGIDGKYTTCQDCIDISRCGRLRAVESLAGKLVTEPVLEAS